MKTAICFLIPVLSPGFSRPQKESQARKVDPESPLPAGIFEIPAGYQIEESVKKEDTQSK